MASSILNLSVLANNYITDCIYILILIGDAIQFLVNVTIILNICDPWTRSVIVCSVSDTFTYTRKFEKD